MEVKPLSPGLYVCRFNANYQWKTIDHVIGMLNKQGEPFNVQFIPELPSAYQILNQIQEDKDEKDNL